MKAEEFLSRAYRLDQQIQSKVDQLQRIRACASGSGIQYRDAKVKASGPENKVENTVVKILEEERVINEEIDRLVEIKREIREVIARVEDVDYRLVLEERNLLFKTWWEISRDMGMGIRWTQMKHREAVKAVQEVLDRMEWEEGGLTYVL